MKTAFVKLDEFHFFMLVIEDGIPRDSLMIRREDAGSIAFRLRAFMEKLEISPEDVHCEGYGFGLALLDCLRRRDIVISRMQHTEEFRDASFEIDQACRLHYLRECVATLQKLEAFKQKKEPSHD